MADVDADELLALAVAVADEAGELLLDYATGRSLRVEHKTSATDPVSEADHASEDLITRRLAAARPQDGILGEEDADNREGLSGLRWVVDPLDGTVNFLYGMPQWCVSVAAEDPDGPLVGAVAHPSAGETFAAARGRGASLAGESLHVTGVERLDRTLVATGFSYDAAVRSDQGQLVARLLRDVRDVRRAGAAALDLAWVAAGRVDAYLEHGLSPWDWAAGALLVTEAGGTTARIEQRLGGAPRSGLVAGGPHAVRNLTGWLDVAEHAPGSRPAG